MIEILSKTELTSHEVFNSYPKHFSTPEINLKVPEEEKFKIIDELKTLINSSGYVLIDIDGIRLGVGGTTTIDTRGGDLVIGAAIGSSVSISTVTTITSDLKCRRRHHCILHI